VAAARTQWTTFYLDPATRALTGRRERAAPWSTTRSPGRDVFDDDGPRDRDHRPLAAKLFVSSSTADADLFLILRVFDPNGRELTFFALDDPHTPIANGWLRASHRRLDPKKSTPWQPHHPHDRVEPLTPDTCTSATSRSATCISCPRAGAWRSPCGARTTNRGRPGRLRKSFHYSTRHGGMTHNDPISRPATSSAAP